MVKKAVRGKATKKKALRGKATRKVAARGKAPTKQALRKGIQRKIDRKLAESVKLAQLLEKQNVGPDEIAASVKEQLAGLGDEVAMDVLRLAGSAIHVHMGTES